jgi:hypothetical protein
VTAQLNLIPHPDPIEAALEAARKRGLLTPWVQFAMRAWEKRQPIMPCTGKGNRNPGRITCIEAGFVPIACKCMHCGGAALIFPSEEGGPPAQYEGGNGICVCPKCSFDGSLRRQAVP